MISIIALLGSLSAFMSKQQKSDKSHLLNKIKQTLKRSLARVSYCFIFYLVSMEAFAIQSNAPKNIQPTVLKGEF
jgi:type III secretory pathway lipoprotein EscJ